jgi:hypothetical protein
VGKARHDDPTRRRQNWSRSGRTERPSPGHHSCADDLGRRQRLLRRPAGSAGARATTSAGGCTSRSSRPRPTQSSSIAKRSSVDGQLDLVLADVFPTDWRGHDLAEHLRRPYRDLKVMLMSEDPQATPLKPGETCGSPSPSASWLTGQKDTARCRARGLVRRQPTAGGRDPKSDDNVRWPASCHLAREDA